MQGNRACDCFITSSFACFPIDTRRGGLDLIFATYFERGHSMWFKIGCGFYSELCPIIDLLVGVPEAPSSDTFTIADRIYINPRQLRVDVVLASC